MAPLDYLKAYIKQHGGTAATAKHLGLPYSTLASFANGHRGISPAWRGAWPTPTPCLTRTG